MSPMGIFNWLTPKDETKESLLKWRQRIALWGAGTTVLLLLFAWMLFDPTTLSPRLVSVAAAEEIHTKIQEDISGIKGSLTSLVNNDLLRATREMAREIREVRSAILDLQLRACQSEGPLRVSLNQQVGQLRSDYMALTGEEYPPTPCSDLLGG